MRPNIWFTSDWHFGHTQCLTLGPGRPFASIAEHDEELIARHNAVVAPDDLVWVLGDVAMGLIEDSLAKCARMNGRKWLICGNHDRPAMASGDKAMEWEKRYRSEGGFERIIIGDTEPRLATIGGHQVQLSHYPYQGDSGPADRFVERRPIDHGGWLLHGHVHHAWKINGRMINVGVDAHDYRPVSEATIAGIIQSAEAHPPSP